MCKKVRSGRIVVVQLIVFYSEELEQQYLQSVGASGLMHYWKDEVIHLFCARDFASGLSRCWYCSAKFRSRYNALFHEKCEQMLEFGFRLVRWKSRSSCSTLNANGGLSLNVPLRGRYMLRKRKYESVCFGVSDGGVVVKL